MSASHSISIPAAAPASDRAIQAPGSDGFISAAGGSVIAVTSNHRLGVASFFHPNPLNLMKNQPT